MFACVVAITVIAIILGLCICASYPTPTTRDQPRDLLGNPIPYHKLPEYDHHQFAKLAKLIKKQQANKDK